MTTKSLCLLLLSTAIASPAHAESKVRVLRLGGAFLGVESLRMSEDLRAYFDAPRDSGVLVSRVVEDSPADDAGVEVGDVIVAVDGEGVPSVGDLRRLINRVEKDRKATLKVIRRGSEKSLEFTPAVRESASLNGEDFDVLDKSAWESMGLSGDIADKVRKVMQSVETGEFNFPQIYVQDLRDREAKLDERLKSVESELRAMREKLED